MCLSTLYGTGVEFLIYRKDAFNYAGAWAILESLVCPTVSWAALPVSLCLSQFHQIAVEFVNTG